MTAYPAAPLDHAEISGEVGAATRAFAKLPGKGFRGGTDRTVDPEQTVARIIALLWFDYGVSFCPQEEPLLALKLYVLLEAVEEDARRRRFEPSLN